MNERISAHAQTVLGVLAEKRCHLTAEEILAQVQGVGTATVYRALDHLTEIGKIRRLALGKRSAVYEYIRDSHMHFVCSRCGFVCDIQEDLSGLVQEAAVSRGYHVNWSEVTVHGVCGACLAGQETGDLPAK